MRRLIHWRIMLISLSLAAALGAMVRWLTGVPFWAGFVLVVVGMVVNGVIAEIEDNRPGGFNNPR